MVVVVTLRGFVTGEFETKGQKEEADCEEAGRTPAGRQAVQLLLALGFLSSLKYASYF